jgi:hypothetical protein
MGLKIGKRGQGATEYLLMLAAVLVIVAVAIYYVTRAGGYPAISMNATSPDNHVYISVLSGSIAAGQWAYYVGTVPSSQATSSDWTTGDKPLAAPSVDLGTYTIGTTEYVNIKHISTGHIYFASDQVITVGSS